ncbi:hypothetical protein S2M10_41340 [Sphingomonas sp. S2M10]|nr:hypothetical protein [Sphingomonas sp. S2M10]
MRSTTLEPSPGTEVMSIAPRRLSMVRLTTSMPTPRPDRLVTAAAVEKPGWKISWSSSLSLSCWPGWIRPCASALARTRSRSIPRPSSWMVISTSPPAWWAERRTWPVAGLPAAMRSASGSRPWSQALRIRWTIGSASRSITVLSTSVASPSVDSSIALPVSRARSWISRRKRPNSVATGTMRSTIIVSRSSLTSRSISSEIERSTRSAPLPFASCERRLWTMTSSPTRSISSSSRSAGTRTLSPVLVAALAGPTGSGAAAAVATGASILAAGASASPPSSSTVSSISSITNRNTSSISSRDTSP